MAPRFGLAPTGSDWSTGKDSWRSVNLRSQRDQGAANPRLGASLASSISIPWQKKARADRGALFMRTSIQNRMAHAKMNDGKGEVILERVKAIVPATKSSYTI